MIGFNCRFLQGRYTDRRVVAKIREAVEKGERMDVELLNYRKDGSPFINRFEMLPVHASKTSPREVTHFVAVQKDVSKVSIHDQPPENWKPFHVAMFMETTGLEEFVGPIVEHSVNGTEFMKLDDTKLRALSFSNTSVINTLLHLVESLRSGVDIASLVDQYRSLSSSNHDDFSSNTNTMQLANFDNPLSTSTINGSSRVFQSASSTPTLNASLPNVSEHAQRFVLSIQSELFCTRASAYDAFVSVGNVVLYSSPSTLSPIVHNDSNSLGFDCDCLVLPIDSCGISNHSIGSDLLLYLGNERAESLKKCVSRAISKHHKGVAPVGSSIMLDLQNFYVLLICLHRTFPQHTNAPTGYDSYFNATHRVLCAIEKHNQKARALNNGFKVQSLDNEPGRPASLIRSVLLPVFTPANLKSVSDGSASVMMDTEDVALSTVNQMALAFKHFKRLKKKFPPGLQVQDYVSKLDEKLRSSLSMSRTQLFKKFLSSLSEGTLAQRGLLNQTELDWLVAAIAASPTRSSKEDYLEVFTHNRRTQRLALLATAGLLTCKYFPLSTKLDELLCRKLVSRTEVLDVILRASATGLAFAVQADLGRLGQLKMFSGGASAGIYRTVDFPKPLAIKIFREEIKVIGGSSSRESTLMRLLRHPRLVPVIGRGVTDEGHEFLVMPYYQQGSLFSYLHDNSLTPRRLPLKQSVLMMLEIAQGLHYLHSLDIMHRDIKSLNILLDEHHHLYLTDYGSSRVLSSRQEYMTAAVGTTNWMAPELLLVDGRTAVYSLKADIYSFAMVCYEILTLKVPFDGLAIPALCNLLAKGKRPELPSSIPKALQKLVSQCWNIKPARRPDTQEILCEVDRFLLNMPQAP